MSDHTQDTTTDSVLEESNVTSTAPLSKVSPGEWLRTNLFSTTRDSIITVIVGALVLLLAWLALQWIIGVDFRIVRVNLRNFIIGRFPRDELWRPWASGIALAAAAGFTSGAMARTSHETAIAMELPSQRESMLSLIRRFWPLILVMILFTSFARTALPYIGMASVFLTVMVMREIGWQMPAVVRQRAVYIGAMLVVVSMLLIAGTSRLGGLALGLIAAIWASSEVGKLSLAPGLSAQLTKIGAPVLAFVIVYTIEVLIPHEGFGWEDWGGLHVSLFVTVIGITLGLPFGILLALGRKSDLPVIKAASTIFIEFVRGVPLISLLLFSSLILKLFFPLSFTIPADLTLAIIVITGFSAAYIAEIVRGGLQAVPKGQTEAAQASGMSASKVQRLIVLPQALQAVIPAMVGQFISLFKDSSLLSIIGITEFLRVSDIANAQPEFQGKLLAPVTYLFVAVGYWAFAYTMSRESRRLETKLRVGVR